MSELEGFEVLPTFDQRTNKGKIGYRNKHIAELEQRIEQLEALVRDMYTEWCATVDDYYAENLDGYYERMAALGLMEVDE